VGPQAYIRSSPGWAEMIGTTERRIVSYRRTIPPLLSLWRPEGMRATFTVVVV
jgi:hypothetical protein